MGALLLWSLGATLLVTFVLLPVVLTWGRQPRLVALLAVRQAYIDRAAQLKTGRDQVRDPERIEDVVAKVIAEGKKAGLSAEIAEPVWRALIEASIRHEFEKFDEKNG